MFIRRSPWLWILVAAFGGVSVGCGDDGGQTPDAGPAPSHRLEVVMPPGDSIGLTYSASETLRVRYTDEEGTPLPGETVSFEILAQAGESAAGAVLSANSSATDQDGIATVELSSGAEDANFRVQADAPAAPTALFFVAVSASGFADLHVTPRQDGKRPRSDLPIVEGRLFRPDELRCHELDPDNIPASVLPPRTGVFDEPLEFQNLVANAEYTLVAWAAAATGGRPLSIGCVDLAAAQVPTGPPVRLEITVIDRPLELPAQLLAESTFGLAPVADAVSQALPTDPWDVLSCPLGAAQLLIDCTLDAHTADGNLDCIATGADSDGLVADVEAARGTADGDGCRPAMTDGGMDSIDKTVSDALAAGGWNTAITADLVAGRADILSSFSLTSTLDRLPEGFRHRLAAAGVTALGTQVSGPLVSSERPVLDASPVPATVDFDRVTIETHGFTLRYGLIARTAFAQAALDIHGLAARADDLGSAMSEAVASGSGGCDGLSELLCATGAHAMDCAAAACSAAAVGLDATLNDWQAVLLDTTIDFTLAAVAPLRHDELSVSALGLDEADTPTGVWQTELSVAGSPVTIVGSFGATPVTAE